MEEIQKIVHIVLILVFIVLGHSDAGAIQMRCKEREREALLAFKQGMVDDSNHLSSWGSRELEKQDCCTWEGVYCSNRTGHVIKLDLGGLGQYDMDYIFQSDLKGTMISPKMLELKHLQCLNLSGIDFSGSHIPDFIGSLSNLRYLDLSRCYFGGQIPNQIGNLTRLKFLALSADPFTSNTENLNWLAHLSSLTHLDLSNTNLSNVFDWPETINELPKLTILKLFYCDLPSPLIGSTLHSRNASKSLASVDFNGNHLSSSVFVWLSNYNTSLIHLDLSSNLLTGSIPDIFGSMSSLEYLDLSGNQLEGGDPYSFARLCSLQSLDLSGNNLSVQVSDFFQMLSICAHNSLERLRLSSTHLSGSLPDLTNFTSLKFLSLRENNLTGRVPEILGELSELERIDFGLNSLEGVISEAHFSKLSKLKYLDLSSNPLHLNFSSDWIPPFQLDGVLLRSCKIGTYFPKWLQTQKGLSILDISNAGIADILPSWFWGLFNNVSHMNISHNQIRGSLANFSTVEFAKYADLDLSSNQLEGPIPSFLSKAFSLDLSNNKISGSISFLCASDATGLWYLDLSHNNVSGELPDCLTHLESLIILDLSHNTLSGNIPTTIGFLLSLETLNLRSNRFVGELPSSLKNCTRLVAIDLGDNRLSGPLPKWLGVSFQKLVILLLSSNHFNGSMPSQLCHLTYLQILDVSVNNMSGGIPKCISNWTTLAQKGTSSSDISHTSRARASINEYDLGHHIGHYEDEAIIRLKGFMYLYKSNLGLMKSIDLSNNRLAGEIPSEITHLVGLISLNLSRNQLTGGIPSDIGKLDSLDSLDLSRNQIDGRIPTSLARIDRLGFLDLSYNNLSGEIPKGTQLQGFDPSVYAENPQLCGKPLPNMCTSEETGPNNEQSHEDKDDLVGSGFYISMMVGFVVGFWGVCASLIFIRSWRYTYLMFLNGLNDWLYVKVTLIKRQWNDA